MDNSPDAKTIAENLKAAMRRFPQGVTVVTTQPENGPVGITVASFTSISLTPPLVLVSIAKGSYYHDLFVNTKAFAVNILASDQGDVSERFAGKVPQGEDRFRGVKSHAGSGGSPLIENALSWIECRNWKTMDAGDHTIILGEVTQCMTGRDAPPLLYFNRQYATIGQLEPLARDYENLFMGW
jgi:flavin reductase (DIM6/NTAB) family NADH-FMN oxidoreductase RutF